MGSAVEKREVARREDIPFEGGVIVDERPIILTDGSWTILYSDLDLGQNKIRQNTVMDRWPNHSVSDGKMAHEAELEVLARTNIGQRAFRFVAREMTYREAVEAKILSGITVIRL